jgi:hypothetical protein
VDTSPVDRRLELSDIEDLRAYERGRDEYRKRVIDLKRKRRIQVGPLITVVFENRETIRFQIQEMARIEKMATDEQIQGELDVYNPLIPTPGELSATLFVELTSEAAMREWLPKLVGVETAVEVRVGPQAGSDSEVVRSAPEAAHAEALTRESVTASVHYLRFPFTTEQVEHFAKGPASLAVAHAAYMEETVLDDETRTELLFDLRP